MDPILDAIDDALKKKGLSDAAASKLAVGHPSLIKNFRAPREGEKRYNVSALQKLADVLDLEFYFGPPRDAAPPPVVRLGDRDYSEVKVYDVDAAAGNGIVPAAEDVTGRIAFPRPWLARCGIEAGRAGLVRVRGDSMTPTIPDGAYALVDFRGKLDWTAPGIYIIRLDDAIVVKRLVVVDMGKAQPAVVLVSDNPTYPPIAMAPADPSSFQPIARVRAVISSICDTST